MPTLVLDIETAPQALEALPEDLRAWVWARATSGLEQAPTLEAAQADPERPEHRAAAETVAAWMALRAEFAHAVCIGLGVANGQAATLDVGTFVVPTPAEEARVLAAFWARVHELVRRGPTRWVTYNGLAFDLPFLLKRSALLGLEVPVDVPLRRYAPRDHYDVLCMLSNWEPAQRLPLAVAARLFGLAKSATLDAAGVARAWRDGQLDAIAEYCAQDVRVTWELFRRLHAAGLR